MVAATRRIIEQTRVNLEQNVLNLSLQHGQLLIDFTLRILIGNQI